MKLTYDPKRNVAYFRIREPAGEVDTIRISDDLFLDLMPDGSVCGIEFLNANEQLSAADDGQIVVIDPRNGEEHRLPLPQAV
jgi:uncharacterized protein YuzE